MDTYTCSNSLKTCKRMVKSQIQGQWLPLGAEKKRVTMNSYTGDFNDLHVMCLLYFLNIFWRKYEKLESLNKAGCSLCYSLYLSLCEDNYNRRYLVFENHNVDHWIWWPPSLDFQLRDSKKINFQNKVCENDKLWVRFLKFTYTFGTIRILKTIKGSYIHVFEKFN